MAKPKKKMKLSTAILAGSKLSKPLTGDWVYFEDSTTASGKLKCTNFAACALGAAVIGYYGRDEYGRLFTQDGMSAENLAHEIWGKQLDNEKKKIAALDKKFKLNDCGDSYEPNDLSGWVISLNDNEGWSRQRIAKALASVGL